jgi:membrane-associated phospholipid phosphatase
LTFETVAAAYFAGIGVLSPLAGAPPRRVAVVAVTGFVLAAGILALSQAVSADARGWVAHLYLVAGYWLPALLVTRPPGAFEAWLRRTDRPMGRSVPAAELAYLFCYPLVPAAFTAVYVNGSIADVDRFWTSVLGAGYACYISLPWLVSRPPRRLEDGGRPSAVGSLNVRVLDRFSHGWNTFPSGHVAVAIAAALSAMPVAPRAGAVLVVLAAGVVVGSVSGRYHYAVDALAGIIVGVIAWAIS